MATSPDRRVLVQQWLNSLWMVRYAGSEHRRKRDMERRETRISKGRKGLEYLNTVKRKKIDVQKLTSQVSRMLERSKCLKYFDVRIEEDGKTSWSERSDVIE